MIHVPGHGELFVRDTGGDGPPVLLLHGWAFAGDLNWLRVYAPLAAAGYRVLAIDHRGHGRGLRTPERFRLADCAADAAALVRARDLGRVIAVGYSMGGSIAQLMARNHPDTLHAVVLGATAPDWSERYMRRLWRSMVLLRLVLSLFPAASWRRFLRWAGFPESPLTSWYAAELSRGSGRDIAEAGRELGRFDSRTWIGSVGVPAAVVVTTRDRSVPPRKQRELARLAGAAVFEVEGDHDAAVTKGERFSEALVEALAALGASAEERIAL